MTPIQIVLLSVLALLIGIGLFRALRADQKAIDSAKVELKPKESFFIRSTVTGAKGSEANYIHPSNRKVPGEYYFLGGYIGAAVWNDRKAAEEFIVAVKAAHSEVVSCDQVFNEDKTIKK